MYENIHFKVMQSHKPWEFWDYPFLEKQFSTFAEDFGKVMNHGEI